MIVKKVSIITKRELALQGRWSINKIAVNEKFYGTLTLMRSFNSERKTKVPLYKDVESYNQTVQKNDRKTEVPLYKDTES